MVLLSFHYALTSLWLGVWFGWPLGVPVVVFIHYTLQLILWAADLNTSPTDVFWGWQALVSFCGSLVAMAFLWAYRRTRPHTHALLQVAPGHAVLWVKGVVATAAYVAIQLLYSHFPAPTSAYGIVFMVLATLVLFAVLWNALLYEGTTLTDEHFPLLFFATWALVTIGVELGFYIAYTGLAEHWVALVALAIGVVLVGLGTAFYNHVLVHYYYHYYPAVKRMATLPRF